MGKQIRRLEPDVAQFRGAEAGVQREPWEIQVSMSPL